MTAPRYSGRLSTVFNQLHAASNYIRDKVNYDELIEAYNKLPREFKDAYGDKPYHYIMNKAICSHEWCVKHNRPFTDVLPLEHKQESFL